MENYFCKAGNVYAAKYTVQNSLWNNVCDKAAGLGYDIIKRNGDGELPVTRITYYDAVKFCNALNEICGCSPVYFSGEEPVRNGRKENIDLVGEGIRLPTELEWEYAVAGDKETVYFWGDEKGNNRSNEYAWMYDLDDEKNAFLIRKPGLKKPNEFGLYDVCGNVYEWCFDKFEDTDFRIMKGGSVTLDSVIETKFTSYAPGGIECVDIGIRIFSDIDMELPNELFENNESDIEYKNHEYDLFDFLDLETEGLEQVKELYENGKITEAKREYVCILKKRAENVTFDYSFYMPINMKSLERLMAVDEGFKWFDGEKNFASYHGLAVFAIPLAEMYRTTGEKKYLNQFIKKTKFTKYAKNEFDNLLPEDLNRVSATVPDSWCYTQGFDSCVRMGHVCTIVLTMLLKYVDYSDITDEFAEAVITHMVRTIAEDLPLVLKDSRSVIPNQSLENAKNLIFAGNIFYGYKNAKIIEKIGYSRILEATIEKCIFPDGTDMEQSYNYNFAICRIVEEFIECFGELPEQMVPIREAAIKRIRFLKCVSYPHGGYPATGTMSGSFTPIDCKSREEISEFARLYDERNFKKFENIDNEELDVTTVCFPYSATTVIKSSRDWDAVYLWHFAARAGSGHAVENVNSIQLSAFGMPMLVNAGASTYENIGFLPEGQWDMMHDFEMYQHSSRGANTVLIDGKGQGRLRYGENNRIEKYNDCCPNAFYTDEYFDYSQGIYKGVYHNEQGEFEAEHLREVIYVKKHNVFIVRDTLKAEGEHEFSAKFGIMPEGGETRMNTVEEELYLTAGYCADEVVIEEKHVYTKKKNYPNFEIYAVGNNAEVMSKYGEKNPCEGWFRGAIRSGAKEKTDICISWKGKDVTENITVISVSENEKLHIKGVHEDKGVLKISLDSGNITFDGDVIETDEVHFFNIIDAKIPKGFKWVRKDGKLVPDYGF